MYCELDNVGKHACDLFSTSITGFPGGNKETLQQLHQVNRHPGKFRNGVSRILKLFNVYSLSYFTRFFIIDFIHFVFERTSLKFLLR